jgi:chromosome segregation ATPase
MSLLENVKSNIELESKEIVATVDELESKVGICLSKFQELIASPTELQFPSVPTDEPKFSKEQIAKVNQLKKINSALDQVRANIVKLSSQLDSVKSLKERQENAIADLSMRIKERKDSLLIGKWCFGLLASIHLSSTDIWNLNSQIAECENAISKILQAVASSDDEIQTLENSLDKKNEELQSLSQKFQNLYLNETDSTVKFLFTPKSSEELNDKLNRLNVATDAAPVKKSTKNSTRQ